MKKSIKGLSLLFMALVLVLGVTACNNNTEKKDDNKTEAKKDNSTNKVDKKALGGDLSTFAYDVQVAISNADAPYDTLNGYAGAEGTDYVAADVADAFNKTQTSASAFDSLTVPDSLKDYKDQLDASLASLKDAFAKRAVAAKTAGVDTVKDGAGLATAVDAITKDSASKTAFDDFQTKFNEVAKSLGLSDMDFSKALDLPFAQ